MPVPRSPGGETFGLQSAKRGGFLSPARHMPAKQEAMAGKAGKDDSVILSIGEAVVDFFSAPLQDGTFGFRPVLGGSPFNLALGLGRLGTPVGYSWALSTDLFGGLFLDALTDADVDVNRIVHTSLPSTLAFVDTSAKQPRYAFFDHESAGRVFDPVDASSLTDDIAVLHTGSFALGTEPVGSRLENLLTVEAGARLISLDINVRPELVDDDDAYRSRLTRLMAIADIIKASDEDLAWLYPDVPHDFVIEAWLEAGAAICAITLGPRGARVSSTGFDQIRPPHARDVVDTVGAGDAFMAGFLASLEESGAFRANGLARLNSHALEAALDFGQRASAHVCAHRGAEMPWRYELMD